MNIQGATRMKITERDYQYRDCRITHYTLDEEKRVLILHCNYLDRNLIRLVLHDIYAYDALELLHNHIIDYIIRRYDAEAGTNLFEIHFMNLYEVTNIWAWKMLQSE